MKVQVFNQTQEHIAPYESVLIEVFKYIESNDVVQVIFVDDTTMTSLNKTYRNIEKTTDVLTFPSDKTMFETIGDIFININKAHEQAILYGHSNNREIAFLAVHGYLHILGYDHHNEVDENKMISAQESILKRAGLERT